jgi:hypothetical protein
MFESSALSTLNGTGYGTGGEGMLDGCCISCGFLPWIGRVRFKKRNLFYTGMNDIQLLRNMGRLKKIG